MGRPCVLITGARAPVAVHMARLMRRANYRVVMSDHIDAPLGAASKAIDAYRVIPSFRLDPSAAADQLRRLISEEGIGYVIPTCEEVFYLSRLREDGALPAELVAPPIALLERVHNKFLFIETVRSMGLPAPETHLLRCAADLDPFRLTARDYVFKPVWSRFASDLRLRPEPHALADVLPSHAAPWVAQHFLPGTEISVYAMAHQGRLTGLSVYRSLIRAGPGAGVCFEPVQSDRIRSFVKTFVAQTTWSGQISFDFILRDDGTVMPLECNPRATSGLHFFAEAERFADALLSGGAEVQPSVTTLQGVRLAVWLYGLSGLFRRHGLQQFWRAIRQTEDVLWLPSDPIGPVAQLRSLLAFARIARATGRSLQEASTYDLEWNGPDGDDLRIRR